MPGFISILGLRAVFNNTGLEARRAGTRRLTSRKPKQSSPHKERQ